VITVPKRYGQTDGQTDDMQSHNRALLSLASRGKHADAGRKVDRGLIIICVLTFPCPKAVKLW